MQVADEAEAAAPRPVEEGVMEGGRLASLVSPYCSMSGPRASRFRFDQEASRRHVWLTSGSCPWCSATVSKASARWPSLFSAIPR